MINLNNLNTTNIQSHPGEVIILSNGKICVATINDISAGIGTTYLSTATGAGVGYFELKIDLFNSDMTFYKSFSNTYATGSKFSAGYLSSTNYGYFNGKTVELIENNGYIYIFGHKIDSFEGNSASVGTVVSSAGNSYHTAIIVDLELNLQTATGSVIDSLGASSGGSRGSPININRDVNSNSFKISTTDLLNKYPAFVMNSYAYCSHSGGYVDGTPNQRSEVKHFENLNGIQTVTATTGSSHYVLKNVYNVIQTDGINHTVYINNKQNTLCILKTSGLTETTISVATGGVQTTSANICLFYGYNNKIFIAYVSGTNIIYKEWNTVTNTFSAGKTLTGGTGNGIATNFTNNYMTKFGINHIISNITFKSGFSSCIIEQNLSTNDLNIIVQSSNSLGTLFLLNGFIFDWNATYSLRKISTNSLSNIVPSNATVIPNIEGTAFLDTYLNKKRYFDTTKGYWKTASFVEDGTNIYKLILNKPTGNSINSYLTKITPTIVNVTSIFKSINFVTTGMTGFTYQDTKTVPSGCSVSYRYSINNGTSWAAFTAGTPVTVSGSTLLIEITLTPTTTLTPVIFGYQITVAK